MTRQLGFWVVGAPLLLVILVAGACSERFGACRESACLGHSTIAGEGGESINLSGGAAAAEKVTTDAGGGAGGAHDAEAMAGDGGALATPAESACSAGFSDWLISSFSFPDGNVLGTADRPSMPWASADGLEIDSGRLTGTGTTVINQGLAFPYAGSRARFRVQFTDQSQEVAVALNTGPDGGAGVRIALAASGDLAIAEGQVVRGQASFEPLEAGKDCFVEAVLEGEHASVVLSALNYASEKGGTERARVETDGLKQIAKGDRLSVRLDSGVGISPSVDELAVARCGLVAPEYEPRLADTFERANSTTLGRSEFPETSTWQTSASAVRIVDGSLELRGLNSATIPLIVTTSGLRVRATIRMVSGGVNPYLWADVNYNVDPFQHGSGLPGFWVWGASGDGSFHTGIFLGDFGEVTHAQSLAAGAPYFVQLDRDGDIAVLTVRTKSFAGPILAVDSNSGLLSTAKPGGYFTVGDEGGDGTLFDDIRVDSYVAQ
jgi:hypothetical protein